MKPIAVFFHARLSGGRNYLDYADKKTVAINPEYARNQFREQMALLVTSGLYEKSNAIHIGVNGGKDDVEFVRAESPPGCHIIEHGEEAESLLPTFLWLEHWLPDHRDWNVCFWHMKGVSRPNNPLFLAWRQCMERIVIRDWSKCVADLEAGFDTVGAHWISREKYGAIVNPEHGGTPFWGGVFYWAKAEFLLKLPKLIERVTCKEDWYWPEHWIGMEPKPKVKDYHDAWPGLGCANTL